MIIATKNNMNKIDREKFYNVVEEGGKHLGGNIYSTGLSEFNPQKAIKEIADKVDEIVDYINNQE